MFFLGDTHGQARFMKQFLESNEKYCIQVGDFGFVFKYNDYKWNHFLNRFAKHYPEKMIFTVLGNHENFDSIEKMPRVERFGAKCRKIRENIFAVERGEILQLEGKNILCIGGADSIDKDWREPGVSWWPQETISDKDVEHAIENGLSDKYDSIDIIASHAMPAFFMAKTFSSFYECKSDHSLEKIYYDLVMNGCEIPLWIGGHIHLHTSLKYHSTLFVSLDEGQGATLIKESNSDSYKFRVLNN